MFSLDVQLFMFTVNVGLGMILAFLFDGCRVVRVIWNRRSAAARWLTDALDALFWVLAVPLVIVVWGWGNWGQLRFFTFLGLVAGVAIYGAFGSPTLFPAMVTVLRTAVQVGRTTARAFSYAVPRCIRTLGRAVAWVTRGLSWPLLLLGRALAVPLQPLWRPLAPPAVGVGRRLSGWVRRWWTTLRGRGDPNQGTPSS